MAREAFIRRDFSVSSRLTIQRANEIITQYQKQGLMLTLRQVYYQFVSRGLLPNKNSEYKRLGETLNNARLAGLLDWSMIEDRQRYLRTFAYQDSPQSLFSDAAESYEEDPWIGQGYAVEVWIEKDALVGVIERVCGEWRIPYFACRGYSSQSEQYNAGKRILNRRNDSGQTTIILHLGDHDPSGIDMTRDNFDRLRMFSEDNVEMRRLALNMDQVKQYSPPPNPAKLTDSRSTDYIENFGESSWELDALEPTVIADLIRSEVTSIIDHEAWESAMAESRKVRRKLSNIALRFDDLFNDETDEKDPDDDERE